MRERPLRLLLIPLLLTSVTALGDDGAGDAAGAPEEVLEGLRGFFRATARPDGSFQPGIDPDYLGMSDCAYSDLAAVTYAVTLHETFGWTLPYEEKTTELLLSRQKEDGAFFNIAGTVDPASPEGRTYNTTQGLVALRALGVKPRFDPLGVFDEILREDLKELPPYSTSFFPLAYLCAGRAIPERADRAIRESMVQDETGYLNDHIAATFHASHYYRLVGEETPKSHEMVARILRDQKPSGSWLLNMPSRDRHATFDAVFTLVHEGRGRADCRAAIERASRWALSCRNPDGGFGHFPGSTSDMDAVYFHVGTLVMAGFLKPVEPLPPDPHLLSWGHLMPPPEARRGAARLSIRLPGWAASVAFSPDGGRVATGSADGAARVFDVETARRLASLDGHSDVVSAVVFSPDGRSIATGSYDHAAALWDAGSGELRQRLAGHRGVVLGVAFHPHGGRLATAGIDRTIRLWDVESGRPAVTLEGHRSWVGSVAFTPDGERLVSGSSDGTVRVWSVETGSLLRELRATTAEVRSIAIGSGGKRIAAGMRYGRIKVWDAETIAPAGAPEIRDERLDFQGHRADVWSVAFSPDGEVLASGDGDWNRGGFVKLWSIADGREVRRFQHTGEVLCVAFSPDGRRIAAGAADRTVKVWDVR